MRIGIRRERASDRAAVNEVLAAAFANPGGDPPVEVGLVDALRVSDAWIPRLCLVAETETDRLVGHVVCSRAHVDDVEVLALGPLAVHPDMQRAGIGSALMHAVLGAADALDEPLVALLGHREYYPRFGFRPGTDLGVRPPVAGWADHFQVRPLERYRESIRGEFRYAQPFRDLD